MSGTHGGGAVRHFRFLGPYTYRRYARPMSLGIVAVLAGGLGVSYIGGTGGAPGWYGGLIIVIAALAIGVFGYAALWFQPAVATLDEDGGITLAWPRSSTTFHASEVASVRWIRPKSWRGRPLRSLENYRIDLATRRVRVEADPGVFHEFAQAIQAINPETALDVPTATARPGE